MKTNHRKSKRPVSSRNYRKLYIIATEGYETEPAYFSLFNSQEASIHLTILKNRYESDPEHVLERVKRFASKYDLKDSDEVWLVIDRDNWQEEQLQKVYKEGINLNYSLAVSNPCFEYWLLLHFEDGTAVNNARTCQDRLRIHLPHYRKNHIETNKFKPQVMKAIQRAKQKDQLPCVKWPQNFGTTVYRLVDKLQKATID